MMKSKEVIEKTLSFLGFRQQSFRNTFNPESKFSVEVLKDLAKFCRANDTTFHPDPRTHALLEGRREVWLRIQNHLNLTTEELYQLLNK